MTNEYDNNINLRQKTAQVLHAIGANERKPYELMVLFSAIGSSHIGGTVDAINRTIVTPYLE